MQNIKHIIIQAGGRGERLKKFTKNKPKALIPVAGKPIIKHLFDIYQGCKFIVIGDYLYETLVAYLKDEDVQFVKASSNGTFGGMLDAVALIPEGEPFIVTWSDLLFEQQQTFDLSQELAVGLSNTFECRYSVEDGQIKKEPSSEAGVAGFFVFKNKEKFTGEHESFVGDFLQKFETFDTFYLEGVKEIGDEKTYLAELERSRFFNNVTIGEDTVTKEPRDDKYSYLIKDEYLWYTFLHGKVDFVPRVLNTDPFTLQKIEGVHPFEISDYNKRREALVSICESLQKLHALGRQEGSTQDVDTVFVHKTTNRINEVKHLLPNYSGLIIDGEVCVNPLVIPYMFINDFFEVTNVDYFTPIHGDITFSNCLIDDKGKAWMFDPRGAFGRSKIYGHPIYDWAKLYYSVVGNYDSIASKDFSVDVKLNEAKLQIKSNGYESFEELFFEYCPFSRKYVKLVHASIWLSLTGYAIDDLDAVLYAFYKGTYLWNTARKLK